MRKKMLRIAKRNMILIAAAFLLCGLLHILLYRVGFAENFAQLFCAVFTIIWAVSVKERVTNRRLRRILLGVAVALLLYLLVQISRYSLYNATVAPNHFLWYVFYIPMLALPLFCLYLAVFVHRPETAPTPLALRVVIVFVVLLMLGVLTNDLHHCFKSFPEGIPAADSKAKSGWLYYLASIFQYGTYILAFGILLKKSRLQKSQLQWWLPAVPLLVGILYFVLFPLDLGHRVFPARLWNMGEMLVFCLIAGLEACIQVGLIPANTGYEKLLPLVDFPVVLYNMRSEPVYVSSVVDLPMRETEDSRILQRPISGGYMEWEVDVGQLNRLNRELENYTQSIEARNAYLSAEAETRAEKSRLETRNRIYDKITEIVRPQVDSVTHLLDQSGQSFNEELPHIAVLCAYVKRRSNMELLAENGRLSSEECALAVKESLEYVRLCGVNAAMTFSGRESYPAELVIAVYEQMEKIVENSLETLSDLMISLRFEAGEITMRMLLNAAALTLPQDRARNGTENYTQTLTVSKTDNDLLLAYCFREGGERA